ncbi:hypothetical protein [Photobacterium angustum]|uniref:Uncharacterized protein n=1 Tax=Photobacterium angustum TaxID=661 RepID=A0A2S7VHY2_PHOAN|nr:hypothetical protein [Photobacterium angustum]PQJ61767.1 hypothetical protein BTO08_15880 [Photobacterium angustum]
METSKENLLTVLKKECKLYLSIPEYEQQQKRDKKNFIYGLMAACRVVGISFEELNSIIESMPQPSKFKDIDEHFAIPTYVRNEVEIKL